MYSNAAVLVPSVVSTIVPTMIGTIVQQAFLTDLSKRNGIVQFTGNCLGDQWICDLSGREGACSGLSVQRQLTGLLPWELTRGQKAFVFFNLRLEPRAGEEGPGPNPLTPPPQQQNLSLLPCRLLLQGGEPHLQRLEQEGAVACRAPGLPQDTPSSSHSFHFKEQT